MRKKKPYVEYSSNLYSELLIESVIKNGVLRKASYNHNTADQ